jgi:hypothetical protein
MMAAMSITLPLARRLTLLLVGLAAVAGFAATARAHQVEYVSPHPVPHKFGGGFCYIDVPHTHNYRPDDHRMFHENRGQQFFVGDPVPFDYDGPHYTYYGAHPVFEAEMRFGHPVFCYIKGPHFHGYQPPPQAPYQLSGGAYWYVGTFPPVYYQERPHYAVINEAYAPMPYERPRVDVTAAPAVVRAEVSFGGPGWRATAVVGAPPAPVYVPPPPPPAPTPAVQIGVGINLGGGGPPPPVVVSPGGPPGHFRHDHGRHEGRPSRYIMGPAPVREPLLQKYRGRGPGLGEAMAGTQRKPAPAPGFGAPAAARRSPAPGLGAAMAPRPAAQTSAPAPAVPHRGPVAAPGRKNDHPQRLR